jgi:hypothetical protein
MPSYTHNFSTGNPNIDGKIEYSHTRSATGYKVECEIYMRRNNSWKGEHTHGTLTYKCYINNSKIKEDTKKFHVYNGGKWYKLASWSKSFDLNVFSGGSYTVGFSSSNSNGNIPTAFEIKKTTSKSRTVGAYASKNKSPSINIVDNKNNTFTITTKTGKSGDNNKATNCMVYYNVTSSNKTPSNPSATNYNGIKNTGKGSEKGYSFTVGVDKDTKVKAIAYTLGTYNSTSYGEKSGVDSCNVTYYAPPKMNSVSITYGNGKPTNRATYMASWSASKTQDSSPVKGYQCILYLNGKVIYNSSSTTTSLNISDVLSNKKTNLKVGDVLCLSVQAFSKNGAGGTLWSSLKDSNGVTIVADGVLKIKHSKEWKHGIVYIKNDGEWKDSTGVYIKKDGKWEKSV